MSLLLRVFVKVRHLISISDRYGSRCWLKPRALPRDRSLRKQGRESCCVSWLWPCWDQEKELSIPPRRHVPDLVSSWNGHREEINQLGSEIPIAGMMQVWLMPPERQRWRDAGSALLAKLAVCQAGNSLLVLTLWISEVWNWCLLTLQRFGSSLN